MATVYSDLSGNDSTHLLSRAYPEERDAIANAVAAAAASTNYYSTDATRVYSWSVAVDRLSAAIAPWLTRFARDIGDDATPLAVHGGGDVLLLRPDAERKPVALQQFTLEAVVPSSPADILLLRDVQSGQTVVRRLVCRIDDRRSYGDEGHIHSDLARELYRAAAAPLVSPIGAQKARLILESDSASSAEVLRWLSVEREIAHAVLTNELSSGLGYAGSGRAVYHVRLRSGEERIVVEQVSSYTEGYAVTYHWIEAL